jgi:uroporphyrin-III C-methyltransferase
MPGTNYSKLAADLVSDGLDQNTPCAVVSHASLPDQKILMTTIGQLGVHSALPAPAHVLVGRCMNPEQVLDFGLPAVSLAENNSTEGYKD